MKDKKKKYIYKSLKKEDEVFVAAKFKKSLRRSGASKKTIEKIVQQIELMIDQGHLTTSKIHTQSIKLLKKIEPITAANYSIKKAIQELGPSGYPFEVLCAEILKSYGYKTKVGLKVKGEFVNHEVDVYGVREDKTIMCECKFHNYSSHKNDVKIPLYIHSRARDINNNKDSLGHDEFIIFSNTKFSLDAQKYAQGVGMKLVSLNNNDENIIEYIKYQKLYPITCLNSLSKKNKRALLDEKIVTIGQLLKKQNLKLLQKIIHGVQKQAKVIKEAQELYAS